MTPAELPETEAERLDALTELEILDTLPEQAYDDITLLASQICETPIALMSLIDESRQWFKSKVGTELEGTPRDISFCSHAILQPDEILIVPDATADERFADNPLTTENGLRFYAGVPLTTRGGHALGTLCVIHEEPHSLTLDQRQALWALSRQVIAQLELRRNIAALEAAATERDRYAEQLEESQRRLEQQMLIVAEQSVTDSLTDLPNRRALIERLNAEVERAQRYGTTFSIAMIDVDRYKQFNDAFGHVAGDVTLQTIGEILKHETRASDLVGRWGGEEFVAILTDTDAEGGGRFGERYRSAVEAWDWPHAALTVSVGIASKSDDPVDVDQLMIAADTAMYEAKSQGRNRVVVS